MSIIKKIRSLVDRQRLDTEMAEEMLHHVEAQTAANLRAGMSPEEARYAAQRAFGHVDGIKERARDQHRWLWLEQVLQDIRYAGRQMRRNPGFSLAVVLILGLGIGANTAIFGVADAVLWKPLPIRDPGNFWVIGMVDKERGRATMYPLAWPYFQAYREGVRSFSDLVGYAPLTVSVQAGEAEWQGRGQQVSSDFFEVLGVTPILGRTLNVDAGAGADPGAVISHAMWQERWGGAPDVLGRRVQVGHQHVTIVGVAPADFAGVDPARQPEFWIPSTLEKVAGRAWGYLMAGRLAPGVSRGQAEAELSVVAQHVAETYQGGPPPGYERSGIPPTRYQPVLWPAGRGSWSPWSGNRDQAVRVSLVVMAAVGCVLLVACANAANLNLARAVTRRREIAIRLALGAGHGRLVRQLLTESALLSLTAGGLGLLIAHGGMAGLLAWRAGSLAYVTVDAQLDARVFAWALGLAMLTAVVFGVGPALLALRFNVSPALKSEASGQASGRRRFALSRLLLVGQLAMGLVLLAGAGLGLRSFLKLAALDPGFNIERTLVATVALPLPGQKASPLVSMGGGRASLPVLAQVDSLWARLEKIPGVRAVTIADTMLPLSGDYATVGPDELDGYEKRPGERIEHGLTHVGPGYFQFMEIPVVQGREFDQRDRTGADRVVIINETFAKRYWPGQNPLGRRIRDSEVIGVVRDIRIQGMRLDPWPHVYGSTLQNALGHFAVLLKTDAPPQTLAPAFRRELAEFNPAAEIRKLHTLEELWWNSLSRERALLSILGVSAGLAIVLALFGLHALMTYSIAQQTKEIGIHLALGAQRGEVIWRLLRWGLGSVLAGAAIGLLGAVWATRSLRTLLYEISPTDTLTLVLASLLLVVSGLVACYLAARRSGQVDPLVALRVE